MPAPAFLPLAGLLSRLAAQPLAQGLAARAITSPMGGPMLESMVRAAPMVNAAAQQYGRLPVGLQRGIQIGGDVGATMALTSPFAEALSPVAQTLGGITMGSQMQGENALPLPGPLGLPESMLRGVGHLGMDTLQHGPFGALGAARDRFTQAPQTPENLVGQLAGEAGLNPINLIFAGAGLPGKLAGLVNPERLAPTIGRAMLNKVPGTNTFLGDLPMAPQFMHRGAQGLSGLQQSLMILQALDDYATQTGRDAFGLAKQGVGAAARKLQYTKRADRSAGTRASGSSGQGKTKTQRLLGKPGSPPEGLYESARRRTGEL